MGWSCDFFYLFFFLLVFFFLFLFLFCKDGVAAKGLSCSILAKESSAVLKKATVDEDFCSVVFSDF